MSAFDLDIRRRIIMLLVNLMYIGLSTSSAVVSTQPDSTDQFIISHFSIKEGLPSKIVTDVILGKDGYFYAASVGGLIRMDGHHVDVFSTENVPGLLSSRISRIFSLSKEALLIQDYLGNVYRFNDGSVNALLQPGTNERITTTIIRDLGNDALLIADENNVYQVTDQGITILNKSLSSFQLWDAAFSDGSIYLLNTDGFYVAKDDEYLKIEIPDGYRPDLSFFSRIEVIDSHFRLIGQQKSACYDTVTKDWCPIHSFVLKDEQEEIFNIKSYLDGYLVSTSNGLYFQSDGILSDIFETQEGLRYESIFNADYGQVIVGQDGVWINQSLIFKPTIRINDAVLDRQGGLWISSSQDGIYHISKNKFTNFTSPAVVNSYALIKDQNNAYWAGSFENGLMKWTEESFRVFNKESGALPSNTVRMMAPLNDGGVLVSIWGETPIIIRNDDIEQLPDLRPLFGNRTNVTESFHEDQTGKLWFGTLQGLFIKEGNRYRTFYDRNGRTLSKISKIVPSTFTNELFFCTVDQGLVVLRNNEFFFLSDDLPESSKHVRDILISSPDTLWALSYNNGVQRFTRSTNSMDYNIDQLGGEFGFENKGYHRIIADTLGSFWISTNEGLLKVSEKGLNQSIQKGILSTPLHWFNEDSGIIDREFNGGSQNTGFYDSENHRIWFTNSQGLVSFDPYLFYTSEIKEENLRIQSIILEDSVITEFDDSTIELPPNKREVTIKFAHVALSDNQTSSIWIKRSDRKDWTLSNSPGFMTFTDLSPGTTQISFGTEGGNNIVKQIGISIQQRLYQEPLFKLSVGLLSIGLVIALYTINKRRNDRNPSNIDESASERQSENDNPIEKEDKIEEFIKAHLSESDLDITKISKGLGVSRSSLFRMWNETHTISITDYINHHRLEEATRLLANGEYNVTEVAFKCGFSSQSYFTKKFKLKYGYPPSKINID